MLQGIQSQLRPGAHARGGRSRRLRVAPKVAASHQPDLEALYTTQIYSPEPCTSPGVVPRLIPGQQSWTRMHACSRHPAACQPGLLSPSHPPPASRRARTHTGKGLGLVAERDFGTGDLIFLDRPLGIAYGPAGTAPSNEELASAVQKSSEDSPELLEWVRILRSSTRDQQDEAAVQGLFHQHQAQAEHDQDEPERQQQQEASTSGSNDGNDISSPESAGPSAPPLDEPAAAAAAAAAAVSCNSYGEVCEDMAVTELKVRITNLPFLNHGWDRPA